MEESSLRLAIFIGLIITLGLGQRLFPRRKPNQSVTKRWITNFGLVVLNSLIVRFVFGLILPATIAGWSQEKGLGLFNNISLASPLIIILSVIILDSLIYWQHRVFHQTPILWRLHRVHHYDTDYDLSTALRFHPIEILLSILIKNIAIIFLGAPVIAVITFEILLNGMALFNHANIALPRPLDRILRILFVTPDMHRVHHSTRVKEMHSNFGFNLSIWDRIFSSYVAQPADGHQKMSIGQPNTDNLPTNNFIWLLGVALKQKIKP